MRLLLLGAGMGVVGGLVPSPLHFIALTQVAIGHWRRAFAILVGPPLFIDGVLLVITLFFFRYVPHNIAHDVAYAGGIILIGFGSYSLREMHRKSHEALGKSEMLTYASVITAALAELTAPGTWIYWLTIAGPILARGRQTGYWHIVPFFAGGLVGYYGAAIVSTGLLAWGATLHKQFKRKLLLIANVLLVILGVSYLLNAYFRF
jgi:threonine/homoserine/homoserine lactone efflux protein